MENSNYKELGQKVSLNFIDGKEVIWENPFNDEDGTLGSSNKYLQLVNLAVVKEMSIEDLFDEMQPYKLKKNIAILLGEKLEEYKKEKYLFDFNDFLLEFVSLEDMPKFKVLIIDEAQDLSHIQWNVIDRLSEVAEHTHVAGDDDQAIFTWAGAAVDRFRDLENQPGWTSEVLTQSHRVPSLIHALAQNIIARDPFRKEKVYLPKQKRDENGEVIPGKYVQGQIKKANSIEHISIEWFREAIERGSDFLILATTNKLLGEPESYLRKNGIMFSSKKAKEISVDKLNAIQDWRKFTGGEKISGARIKKIYSFLGKNVKHGYKTGKKAPDDLEEYCIQECLDKFGLLTTDIWDKAFLAMKDSDVSYFVAIEESGRKLTDPPQVRVSTISSIKGAEADFVFLYTDLSWGEKLSYQRGNTETDRKFYVAVTRTKQALIVFEPKKYDCTYRLDI
jgi:superfamily I DNA/RNA helicase